MKTITMIVVQSLLTITMSCDQSVAQTSQERVGRSNELTKLQAYPSVSGIKAGGFKYRLFPGLSAMGLKAKDPKAILKTDSLVVVSNEGLGQSDRQHAFPLVQQELTGAIGYLTGTLKLRLGSPEAAQQLAQKHSLELVSSVEGIGLYYFRPKAAGQVSELMKVLKAVKASRQVLSAEPVVLNEFVRAL
jgi:hypothetical protein